VSDGDITMLSGFERRRRLWDDLVAKVWYRARDRSVKLSSVILKEGRIRLYYDTFPQ